MGRRLAWHSLALLAIWGCQERLTAPGSCPDFCPSTLITVVDTVIEGSIARDSAFRGYVSPHRARVLQAAADGQGLLSRAIVRFSPFSERIVLVTGDTIGSEIVAVDSFRVQLIIARRSDSAGVQLALHRIPRTVDSATTFAELDPFFDDSTRIVTAEIPDTLENQGAMQIVLPSDAFPAFEMDEREVAIGIALEAPASGFVNLGTLAASSPPILTRFVQVDSAGADTLARQDAKQPVFNSFVFTGLTAPPADVLFAGGVPSARSILRVDLPSSIIDSTEIVRATLILVPSEPALGAPRDTFSLRAEILAADFGPKSPIVPLLTDIGSTRVAVGTSDTVRVDITHIVQPWRTDPDAPRSFAIRVSPEGSGLGELRFGSSRGGNPPALQLTFVPLILP